MKQILRPIFLLFVLLTALSTSFAFAQQKPEWNSWRGPNRDGHSLETGLLKTWPEDGPKLLWETKNLGAGYSNLTFWGDSMYTMGDIDDKSQLLALSRKDGSILWKTVIGNAGGGRGYPGPKCTPSTDGKVVIVLNQFGDLACVEAKTGKILWKKNLIEDFGGEMMSDWGYAESPLLTENQVVCIPGGEKGSVVALDLETGKEIWRSRELTDKAGYSSIVPAVLNGINQYLVLMEKSVAGIDPKDGKLIWRADFPSKTAVCSDPVYFGSNVFAACSYSVGGYGYKVDGNSAEEVFKSNRLENHHGGIVTVNGHFYLLTNRELCCLDPKTGNVLWRNRSVGKGSIAYADGHLILRSEQGPIALVEVSTEDYKEKSRFEQPDRSDKKSWTHPIIVDGKMYIRDQNLLLVYDVKEN